MELQQFRLSRARLARSNRISLGESEPGMGENVYVPSKLYKSSFCSINSVYAISTSVECYSVNVHALSFKLTGRENLAWENDEDANELRL